MEANQGPRLRLDLGVGPLLRRDPRRRGLPRGRCVARGARVRTSKVRCGSLVYWVGYRHPAVLANALATIDHLWGGRADFGLGAGWRVNEYLTYGIPFPRRQVRLDLLEEAVQCVRRLIRDEVDFEGGWFELPDAACPNRCSRRCRYGSAAEARSAHFASPRSGPTAGTSRSSPPDSPTSERCCSPFDAVAAIRERSAAPSIRTGLDRGEPASAVRHPRRFRPARCPRRLRPGVGRWGRPVRQGWRRTGEHRPNGRRSTATRSNAWRVRWTCADRSTHGRPHGHGRGASIEAEPAEHGVSVLRRRPRGAGAVRRAIVPEPWPALGEGRCEVVLYTPEHDATFASLGVDRRPAGDRPVGGTHRRVRRRRRRSTCSCSRTGAPRSGPRSRIPMARSTRTTTSSRPHRAHRARPARPIGPRAGVSPAAGWPERGAQAWVRASSWPFALRWRPTRMPPICRGSKTHQRDGLARPLIDLSARLDPLFDPPLPYMIWINQGPFDGGE